MVKKLSNILFVLLLLLFIYSIYKIINYNKDIKTNSVENTELINKVITIILPDQEGQEKIEQEKIEIDFEELKSINTDTIGWIKYNQDKINYPIVHTTNNDYYLNHSFQKKNNKLGAIFMDYKNISFEDNNVVIYGHNIKTGAMFGSLNDIFSNNYWEVDKNNYIEIYNTNNELIKYQIFSYYTIKAENYYTTTNFNTKNEFQAFIDTIKKRSHKDFQTEVTINDKILTLTTCHGAAGTNIRRVIHAKRIN